MIVLLIYDGIGRMGVWENAGNWLPITACRLPRPAEAGLAMTLFIAIVADAYGAESVFRIIDYLKNFRKNKPRSK